MMIIGEKKAEFMIFTQLYSSSKGNLYAVTANNGKSLLIECGVVWSKIMKALGYVTANIEGCLLTHNHMDHAKAIRDVIKAGINVYSTRDNFAALGIAGERRAVNVLEENVASEVFHPGDDFMVYPFRVKHDAADPVGFLIKADNETLLFACDTAYIEQEFKTAFNVIALECSYDKDILETRVHTGDINESLAKRLWDSHMEKQVCLDYLQKHCNLTKCREIHLLHMSGDNLNKEKTRQEFEDALMIKTVILSKDASNATV